MNAFFFLVPIIIALVGFFLANPALLQMARKLAPQMQANAGHLYADDIDKIPAEEQKKIRLLINILTASGIFLMLILNSLIFYLFAEKMETDSVFSWLISLAYVGLDLLISFGVLVFPANQVKRNLVKKHGKIFSRNQ